MREPRPKPNDMLPFEWLYWSLHDKGLTKEAQGVAALIASRSSALDDANWQANRRQALEQDATRYRWLRDCGNPFDILVSDRDCRPYYDSRLDAAVDALINRPDTTKETP